MAELTGNGSLMSDDARFSLLAYQFWVLTVIDRVFKDVNELLSMDARSLDTDERIRITRGSFRQFTVQLYWLALIQMRCKSNSV